MIIARSSFTQVPASTGTMSDFLKLKQREFTKKADDLMKIIEDIKEEGAKLEGKTII